MKKNRFITGYAGLRALAVIGVILYHFNPSTFTGGYLGVPIFLVLSGYLVTDHMLKAYQYDGKYDNKSFYLKRVKRLYPQLFTVLWLSAAWIVLFQRNLLAKLNQIVTTNLLSVYNFWQIRNGQSYFERFAANESPFTHLWTMSIEGQFYLLWPVVIFLLFKFTKNKKQIFWIIFGLSIASALEMAILYRPNVDINRIYYGTDTRFFALGLGASLAVIWPISNFRKETVCVDTRILDLAGLVSLIGMIIMTVSNTMNPTKAFTYRGGMFIFTVLTTILVGVIAHSASHWNNWLTNPVFSWIGSRSYGIYLYQFPVMIFFEDKITNIADHPILYRIIELIIILVLSEITYRLIERPMATISWQTVKSSLANMANLKRTSYFKKTQLVAALVILAIGSTGIIISPNVKAKDFNKSKLAETINANKKNQKSHNENLIAQLKKEKNSKNTNQIASAKKNAKIHPVNRNYERYGISQLDLQLAQNIPLVAIRDSVMAGSSNELKQLMPQAIIDSDVSRQPYVASGRLRSYQNKGVPTKNVLIGLGTNGVFSMNDVDKLMKQVGNKGHVFWINTHVPTKPWQSQVNKDLKQAAKKYDNLVIINWYSYAKKHPQWFYEDQTHPTPLGSKYYSAYIVKTIVKYAK